MRWENKIWYAVSFFIGVFVCYLTLQYSYFEIKKELDVPAIIISVITLLIGLFIAVTLQKKVNKGQNQLTYLTGKLDRIWNSFNDFSETLIYEDNVDISSIRSFLKNVVHPMAFFKRIIQSFGVEVKSVTELENRLEALEEKLSNLPAKDNILNLDSSFEEIKEEIIEINNCFAKILREIQEI